MRENQKTVGDWARATFGPATPLRIAVRLNEEVAELLTKVAQGRQGVEEEAADVLVVLYHFAETFGMNLQEEVNRKMAINRQRKWKLDGTGTGQHV